MSADSEVGRASHPAISSALARAVYSGVVEAMQRTSASTAPDRLALRVTNRVVWSLVDHRWEIAADEVSRAWSWATDRGRWELRRWYLAGAVARRLPRDVVRQTLKLIVMQVDQAGDPPGFGALPLRTYLDRWEGRGQ